MNPSKSTTDQYSNAWYKLQNKQAKSFLFIQRRIPPSLYAQEFI